MTMQFRSKDGIPYAPNRDLANSFPHLIRHAAYAMDHPDWLWAFGDYLEKADVSLEDLVPIIEACHPYLKSITDPTIQTSNSAAELSGLLKGKPAALFAFLASLGAVTLSYGWDCGKDAHYAGEGITGIEKLLSAAKAMREKMIGSVAANKTLEVDREP